jgi:hypothetical protein
LDLASLQSEAVPRIWSGVRSRHHRAGLPFERAAANVHVRKWRA